MSERPRGARTTCFNELELKITWVVPVKIEQLGAHIQAYSDTLTIQVNFKLCIKHSSGSMSKLPLEIIDHIIEDVTEMKREEHMRSWSARYYNAVGTCDHMGETLDYIKDAMLKRQSDNWEILDNIIEEFTLICDTCADIQTGNMSPSVHVCCSYCDACFDHDNPTAWREHPEAHNLAEYISGHGGKVWWDEEREQAAQWQYDLRQNRVLHPEWLSILRKNFNLDVWLRPNPEDLDRSPFGDTTALLMLASIDSDIESAMCTTYEDGSQNQEIATCMVAVNHQVLKPGQKIIFQRALHKLKLTPCSELERWREEVDQDGSASKWPQLVSLARVSQHR